MNQKPEVSGSRLSKKLLLVAPNIAPVPLAVSFVVKNFLSEFSPDEFVVATERWPENPADQTATESGHQVEFVSQRWTWPKRGQRFVHWAKWFTLGGGHKAFGEHDPTPQLWRDSVHLP
jgi:hypothetical protein